MISSLLFLTSIELHIHTKEAAVYEQHGQSVSISSFSSKISQTDNTDEISVSPEGLLKIQASAPVLIAIFMLLALVISGSCSHYYRFQKHHQRFIQLPFYGTPALRAPPQH